MFLHSLFTLVFYCLVYLFIKHATTQLQINYNIYYDIGLNFHSAGIHNSTPYVGNS